MMRWQHYVCVQNTESRQRLLFSAPLSRTSRTSNTWHDARVQKNKEQAFCKRVSVCTTVHTPGKPLRLLLRSCITMSDSSTTRACGSVQCPLGVGLQAACT
eukprot:4163909-Amphidinium_carterae.1